MCMKSLIRPIWNYIVGYRNGFIPPFLYERIGQYPYKDETETLFIRGKDGELINVLYLNSETLDEIPYEAWLTYHQARNAEMRRWRNEQFKKNHPLARRIAMSIHYWINNIK